MQGRTRRREGRLENEYNKERAFEVTLREKVSFEYFHTTSYYHFHEYVSLFKRGNVTTTTEEEGKSSKSRKHFIHMNN